MAADPKATPVYRFYNSQTGVHFYTISYTERNQIRAQLSHYLYEGMGFGAVIGPASGLSPVHRFLNKVTGTHFFTINETERNLVTTSLSHVFQYEGISWYASKTAASGWIAMHRFNNTRTGTHFYTASEAEKTQIQASMPHLQYEGVAYYVKPYQPVGAVSKVPHTGVSSSQCYRSNNVMGSCDDVASQTYGQQDGHRQRFNTLSYSAVGSYPLTSCVRDNVTGLIWEGKEASGGRAGTAQTGTPSQYVAYVNSLALCGFTDWRVPSVDELHGIKHYGNMPYSPAVDNAWFPNTAHAQYYAGTAATGLAWFVGMSTYGDVDIRAVSTTQIASSAIRLVRGAPWTGNRYVYTTYDYGDDAPDNAVVDLQQGLIWRRCSEGQTWGGSNCTGTVRKFTGNLAAMTYAKTISGWRMPNIKEMATLADRARMEPAFDVTAFPDAPVFDVYMSTTPFVRLQPYPPSYDFNPSLGNVRYWDYPRPAGALRLLKVVGE